MKIKPSLCNNISVDTGDTNSFATKFYKESVLGIGMLRGRRLAARTWDAKHQNIFHRPNWRTQEEIMIVVSRAGRTSGVLRCPMGGLIQDQAVFGFLQINDAKNGAISLTDHWFLFLVWTQLGKKEDRPAVVAVDAGQLIGAQGGEYRIHSGFE